MAQIGLKELLEAGVHFGHQTRRWNPKMRRFIFGERDGIYLIDLRQTMRGIEESYGYIRDLVAGGGTILFVGTKKQTQGPVATYAEACGMPYVNERWLGGMLTNFQTVSARVNRMKEFEAMQKAGDFDAMPKKEAPAHTTWRRCSTRRTTIACEPKWWSPRRNQPPAILSLMKKTLPQAVEDEGL